MVKLKISRRTILIDADMAEKAASINWQYSGSRVGNFYVRAGICRGSKKKTVFLHHFVLPQIPGKIVDHKNGDTRDNRRANLRYVTRRQNATNGRPRKRLPYKAPVGVTLDQRKGWRVRMLIDGVTRHVGWFRKKSEAMRVAREKHLELHGEHSCYARSKA